MADVLSNEFVVRWEDQLNRLVLVNPRYPNSPAVRITGATLSEMSFHKACQFIGERLVLLMPGLRHRYVNDSVSPGKLKRRGLTSRSRATRQKRRA
jgi:hypothetical protein